MRGPVEDHLRGPVNWAGVAAGVGVGVGEPLAPPQAAPLIVNDVGAALALLEVAVNPIPLTLPPAGMLPSKFALVTVTICPCWEKVPSQPLLIFSFPKKFQPSVHPLMGVAPVLAIVMPA